MQSKGISQFQLGLKIDLSRLEQKKTLLLKITVPRWLCGASGLRMCHFSGGAWETVDTTLATQKKSHGNHWRVFFMCVGHWTRTSLPPGLDCFSYRLAGAEPGITHSMAGSPETDCFMVKPKWPGTPRGQTITDMGEMSNLNATLYHKGLSGSSFLMKETNVEDKSSVQLTTLFKQKSCCWLSDKLFGKWLFNHKIWTL